MNKKITLLLLMVILSTFVFAEISLEYFEKGLIYYLLDDKPEAQKKFEDYFRGIRKPILRRAYDLLLQNDLWEANRVFKSYLNMHKYSITALVGVALSNSDDKERIEFLKRAIRFYPNKPQPFACIAIEYLKNENYNMAREMIEKAIKFANVNEYQLIYAKIFLNIEEYQRVINILLPNEQKMKDNFYFNFFISNAFFSLNQLKNKKIYIDRAINLKSNNSQTKILLAKYYIKAQDFRKAGMILREMKNRVETYTYYILYAELLLKLKDNKCLEFLNKAFIKNPWGKDLNILFARYYSWKNDMVRRKKWIERSLIGGIDSKKIKVIFPDIQEETKEFQNISFFKILRIEWLDENKAIVVGNKNYDSKGSIYIIDVGKMRIINSLVFQGNFQDLFVFKGGERVMFSENRHTSEEVAIYSIEKMRTIRLVSKSIPIPTIHIGYDEEFDVAYVTDARVKNAFYKSPFNIKLRLGKVKSVFPNFPFYVYRFNFRNKRLDRIRKFSEIRNLNINALQKYYLFSEKMTLNTEISKLIKDAEIYDLSSNEEVKLFIPDDLSGFILYYSDLDICFKGHLFSSSKNQLIKIKSEEILGTKDYIGLEVIGLYPEKQELLLITKDNNKTIIIYNYKTKIINKISNKLFDFLYNRSKNEMYILKEKNKLSLWPETELQIISFKPFLKKTIKQNNLIEKIIFTRNNTIFFNTFKGELLNYDLLLPENGFKYIQPAFNTVIHARRIKTMKTLVFINKRLILIK